jgi:hypothetical protein
VTLPTVTVLNAGKLNGMANGANVTPLTVVEGGVEGLPQWAMATRLHATLRGSAEAYSEPRSIHRFS